MNNIARIFNGRQAIRVMSEQALEMHQFIFEFIILYDYFAQTVAKYDYRQLYAMSLVVLKNVHNLHSLIEYLV
jgi:hypothetical protein